MAGRDRGVVVSSEELLAGNVASASFFLFGGAGWRRGGGRLPEGVEGVLSDRLLIEA